MPFIRHAHDKRGYDSTYVMHAYRGPAGPARTKLLYLFRSPAHVQVGRKALDAEVREALEHTHPDLTFDWNGLLRDAPQAPRNHRPEGGRDRDRERERPGRGGRQGRSARPERPSPPVPEVAPDDSPLGQAVGAAEAVRLRHRHAELLQRVGRRARTPEERDRLLAELAGLNPDRWQGPDQIRQAAAGVDRAMDQIAAQLPKRRRGRRGGRAEESGQAAGADVIIGERDHTDAPDTNDHDAAGGVAGDGEPERTATAPTPDFHEPG